MSIVEEPKSLSQVLDRVVEQIEGDRVTVEEILRTFGASSYGPALAFVALISMTPPISVLPGLAIVTGALYLILAAQMLFLRPYPWLPQRILRFSFSREKLAKAVERVQPWARRIGKVVGPRLQFLVYPPFLNLIALICIGLGVLTFILAPLPAGENIPAAAVLFFGLALTARDGLLALIGLLITGVSVGAVIYFWPMLMQVFADLMAVLGY